MACYGGLQGMPPDLRLCISTGENLLDATDLCWKDATGIDIIDDMGVREMVHIFISFAPNDLGLSAIGKAVAGYTAKVVDNQSNKVSCGIIGKLAVIGQIG